MKSMRLVLALLMLVAPTADAAKLMIAAPSAGETVSPGEVAPNNARMLRMLRGVMDVGGVDYTVVPSRSLKTEFCRSGVQVWNYGTAGAYTETFDGVVHLGVFGGVGYTQSGGDAPNYRADSLMKGHKATEAIGTGTTKAPSAPTIFMATNAQALISGDNDALLKDGTGVVQCSTGSNSGGINTTVVPGDRGGYLASDPTVRWMFGTYVEPLARNSTPPGGGWRAHIGAAVPSLTSRELPAGARMFPPIDLCQWCDSMATPAAGAAIDTLVMWERMMSHITGADPVIFVMAAGAGLLADSLSDEVGYRSPTEGEPFLMLAALARMDSILGGTLFTKRIQIALTIDGAFSYNAREHPRGILKADSSTFDASMDSLATLGIPVTFGVNTDSVAANSEWKRWLAKVPKARFSPQNWTAVADTAANSGAASFLRPADMMGRYRRRAAFGDTTTHLGADSTIYKLLLGGRFKCDSIWPGKASRFLMAPDDDWSPLGMNGGGTAPGLDSLVFAIVRAGFDGVRVNSGDPDHNASYLPANPKGWVNQQGWLSGHRGVRLKMLAYPGHGRDGGRTHWAIGDSMAPPDSTRFGMLYQDINRAQLGATQLVDHSTDIWPRFNSPPRSWDGVYTNQKDRVWPNHYRGSVIRMSAGDFSGNPNLPARRGWWAIKSLANNIKAINRLAGRTIIEFAYPEDIDP